MAIRVLHGQLRIRHIPAISGLDPPTQKRRKDWVGASSAPMENEQPR